MSSTTAETLLPEHRAALRARAISDSVIESSGIRSAVPGEPRRVLGGLPPGIRGEWPGIVIPFPRSDGTPSDYARFRPDHPVTDADGRPRKYESPRGRTNEVYVPVGFFDLARTAPYIIVTEGEFKALAGMSAGIPSLGLVGVYGWCSQRQRDRRGRTIGPKRLHANLVSAISAGKVFYVVYDSDAMTKPQVRTAARELARAIVQRGARVGIVSIPPGDGDAKVGMDDYLAAHGSDAFKALLEATPEANAEELAGAEVVLTNLATRFEKVPANGGGKAEEKPVDVALSLQEIAEAWQATSASWPRRCGERLFFHVGTGIRWCDSHHDLFSAIQSVGAVRWGKGNDSRNVNKISREEFFSHLLVTAHEYASVVDFPMHPSRDDVYSTWRSPEGYEPAGENLDGLLGRFSPASDIDASLIRAMFLTLLWGGPPGGRPLFVITGDGTGEQGIGKTTLVEKLSSVVGGPFRVELGIGRLSSDEITKQLVSISAMSRHMCLIDNTTGVLRSSELADLVTSTAVDGRPAYGRQTRRANLLTWAVTTNDLALSTDLASRCVVIRLRPPDRDSAGGWEDGIARFIEQRRESILADALAALHGHRHEITAKRTRFAAWCDEVLSLDPTVDDVLPRVREGVELADSDSDEIGLFVAQLQTRAAAMPPPLAFSPVLIGEVWRQANHDNLSNGWVIRRLNAAIARGKLSSIKPVSRAHGCDWVATDKFWGD